MNKIVLRGKIVACCALVAFLNLSRYETRMERKREKKGMLYDEFHVIGLQSFF